MSPIRDSLPPRRVQRRAGQRGGNPLAVFLVYGSMIALSLLSIGYFIITAWTMQAGTKVTGTVLPGSDLTWSFQWQGQPHVGRGRWNYQTESRTLRSGTQIDTRVLSVPPAVAGFPGVEDGLLSLRVSEGTMSLAGSACIAVTNSLTLWILVWFNFLKPRRERSLISRGACVAGTVTAVRGRLSKGTVSGHDVDYTYQARRRGTVRATMSIYGPNAVPPAAGSEVTVVYDPQREDLSLIYDCSRWEVYGINAPSEPFSQT